MGAKCVHASMTMGKHWIDVETILPMIFKLANWWIWDHSASTTCLDSKYHYPKVF